MIFSVLLGATAIAATPPQTMQAAFDAATKAGNDGRCAEAVAGFDTLAATPAAKRNATVAAAIAVRRGRCLITLSRVDEGAASLRAGVDTLAPNPDFREEARIAYLVLTGVDGDRLDYAQGLADARRALALSTGIERARPLFAIAQFTRFDGDGEAVRASAEGLALVQADPASSKATIGSAQTYAARALMAAGKLNEANALLALANAAAARGEPDAAAGYSNRTGLTQQQCALIGPRPAVKRNGATSSLYPMDAVRMGFGGWARIEYDIAADGRTAAQRALIAYPPFVFGDAAKAMVAQTRYEPSYRPAAGAACSANQQNFIFALPS